MHFQGEGYTQNHKFYLAFIKYLIAYCIALIIIDYLFGNLDTNILTRHN